MQLAYSLPQLTCTYVMSRTADGSRSEQWQPTRRQKNFTTYQG